MTPLIIRRAREAQAQFGIGNTTFYAWQESGLMVPGVRLGGRSVGYPQHELDAIVAARIAGRTDEEIRSLVRDLITSRSQITHLVNKVPLA